MTIYRLYRDNGNSAGFWVQHREWKDVCAQVQSVGGQRTGSLPGRPPDHDDAIVLVNGFDVSSGRRVPLGPALEQPHDRNFRRIADPPWARSVSASMSAPMPAH
jgi:hypothetical protein